MSGLGCSGYLYPSGLVFKKCRALWIPSSCGIEMIRLLRPIYNLWVVGWLQFGCVVSLTYEGRFLPCGCSHLSTNWDFFFFSVMLLQLETMGWILFMHYNACTRDAHVHDNVCV